MRFSMAAEAIARTIGVKDDDIEGVTQMIAERMNEAYERGREAKADELRAVLGIHDEV